MTAAVASADVVIEAAPERLALKRKLFRKSPPARLLTRFSPAILRSFRSTQIGENLPPPPVRASWARIGGIRPISFRSSKSCAPNTPIRPSSRRCLSCFDEVGKRPVKVQRDITGFIGNRLQYALWREAFSLIENGVCDAETIDTVIKNGFGTRLPVLGPMENADLIGLDLARDIYNIVVPE